MAKRELTIFHNPGCGTSRKALALLRERGLEPRVVEYLKAGWTTPQLRVLLSEMGAGARDILRFRGTPAQALGLTDPAVSDDAILDAMVAHPSLVERPIIEGGGSAVLGRPLEKVAQWLVQP